MIDLSSFSHRAHLSRNEINNPIGNLFLGVTNPVPTGLCGASLLCRVAPSTVRARQLFRGAS